MNEYNYEELLNIKTTGEQTHYNDSYHYNKYEATPYYALNSLFENYKINENDRIVDYGCGKGRLNFYASYQFNCKVSGIEMNNYYFEECIKNKNSFLSTHNRNEKDICFFNCLAEEYDINDEDNIFYFFNPFSVQIFMKIVEKIISSVDNIKRDVSIILYYPTNEYIYFLETFTPFTLVKEIIVSELYKEDNREKFIIFTLES